MTFQLTAGWGDSSVNGSARIVAQPSGQSIIVPIVNGELRFNGLQGVPLDSRPGTTYVMFFDAISKGGVQGSVNPIAFPACSEGTVNDVGVMTANAHTKVTPHH
jgi:hypothetical protein